MSEKNLDTAPLIGTDDAIIDDKGRILMSKKKRERLGDGFVLTLGSLGCLVAYPLHVWTRMVSEIRQYGAISQGAERYTRLVVGMAEDDLSFDAQGRVVIPKKLRELAKITDKALLIGCLDRLEIWAEQEWFKYNEFPDVYGRERREAVENAYRNMVGQNS